MFMPRKKSNDVLGAGRGGKGSHEDKVKVVFSTGKHFVQGISTHIYHIFIICEVRCQGSKTLSLLQG